MDLEEIKTLVPEFLVDELQTQFDEEVVTAVLEGYAQRRRVTLRANTLLSSAEEVAKDLTAASIEYGGVDWYGDAFVLPGAREKAVWETQAYQQGKLYLQSLSSMLPPLAMGCQTGEDVLDMCAAPGGKTTQMAALCPGAHITACEMSAPRAEKLQYNLERQGVHNVTVMRTDARRLDSFFSFDRILLDAPCTGSGTIYAQDPKLRKRLTPALLGKCTKSQKALLSKALQVVKPGGTVVYSTCSVLAAENDKMVTDVLKQARKWGSYRLVPVRLPHGCDGIPLLPCSLEGAMLVKPTSEYEGFFMAKIARAA